jgi:hypothetical protein
MKGDTEARGASRRCRPSMPEPEERLALGGRGGDGMAGLPLFDGEADVQSAQKTGFGPAEEL